MYDHRQDWHAQDWFGPRRLGWRPTTSRGWAVLWSVLVVTLFAVAGLVRG